MVTRKQVEERLKDSPLKLVGKAGEYEIHNRHNKDNPKCSQHDTIEQVSDRVQTILGR